MDLSAVENYLPRGREYYDKLKKLETKKINEARREQKDIQTMLKSKNAENQQNKKELDLHLDKVSTLKSRLKKKADEAKEQISKALALGETEAAKELQDLNMKLFEILNMKYSPVKKPIQAPARKQPDTTTFALTSAPAGDSDAEEDYEEDF